MLVRIWTLLIAIALATSAIAVVDLPTAEAVQLCEDPPLDEVVTETLALPLSPPVARAEPRTRTHVIPSLVPVTSIFRPPRLPR